MKAGRPIAAPLIILKVGEEVKYQELMNEAKQSWNKQKQQRFDADDVEWITVNGAHIPLNDEGKAMAGGDLKGEDFSKAKSEESGSKSGKSESKSGKSENKSESKAKSSNAKAKKMSDSIKNAFEDQDFEELSIAVEDAMKEMPVGSVMNFNGSKIHKKSDSQFELEDPWGGTAQTSPYEVFAAIADSDDVDLDIDIPDKSEGSKPKDSKTPSGKKNPLTSYAIEKQGKTYIARNENGYAISSGSDPDKVKESADKIVAKRGPLIGIKAGEKRTFSASDITKDGLKEVLKDAAPGSKVKTKSGAEYEKQGTSWVGKDKAFYSNRKGMVTCGPDILADKGVTEVTYIKK